MAASDLIDFLSYPVSTWQSATAYMLLCAALVWIIYFIGTKYAEIVQAKPARRRPPTPFPDRLQLPPSSAMSRSARSLNPRSPLSQASTASSTGSSFETPSSDPEGNLAGAKRRRAFWPLALPRITVGEVSRSRIAQRRRALSAA